MAGLVMSQVGTYVLAVLTNACGRNDLLTSLIGTLDAVHSGICGVIRSVG